MAARDPPRQRQAEPGPIARGRSTLTCGVAAIKALEDIRSDLVGHSRTLISDRTKELPPRDFVEMMRAAIKEDEWMLYAHGAIMGFGGGLLHLWIFGVGGG